MPLPAIGTCLTCTMVVVALSLTAAQSAVTTPRQEPRAGTQDAQLLVGTWELVNFSRRATDGRVTHPWGNHPAGRITYDSNGHVTALVMHERRNEAGGSVSPPEVQADFSAYFGAYTVDLVQRVVTHRVRGSLNAAGASGDLRRKYEFKDGALILRFTRPQDGADNTLTFRRMSRAGQ